MHAPRTAITLFLVGFAVFVVVKPDTAHAVCRSFEASHNGTDMFHSTGAVGAAINKLMAKVDSWQNTKGYKNVRMSKVRTKCGPWFNMFLLPHRHCVAKARACA